MIDIINNWIDKTVMQYADQKVSCELFAKEFEGFYPVDFLSKSYYVVVDELPRPRLDVLYKAGFGKFIEMEAKGVTYKDTYFVKKGYEDNLGLHFHELVHVLQWGILGSKESIARYMEELLCFGYRDAPLEKMAFSLQNHYVMSRGTIDIPKYVKANINNHKMI